MRDPDLDTDVDDDFEDPTAWIAEEIDPEGYDSAADPASLAPGPPPDVERGAAPPKRGQFPISPAAVPPWVKEFSNGKIPVERMVQAAPLGPGGLVVPEALDPWRAFQEAARLAGFTLTMTNAYRTYDQQLNLFQQRYTTSDTGGKFKDWNGVRYWLKPKVAMAATPGASNHGWGMGIDMALDFYDRRARNVGSDPAFMIWAVANARQYGWSWEVQSEPWHVRLVDYDRSTSTPTPAPTAPPTSATTDLPFGVPAPELIRSATKPVPIIEGVKVLQTILIAQGWATFTEADGRFGEDTEKAVIEMQKALGFTKPDGKYGPKTAAKLGEYLSNR